MSSVVFFMHIYMKRIVYSFSDTCADVIRIFTVSLKFAVPSMIRVERFAILFYLIAIAREMLWPSWKRSKYMCMESIAQQGSSSAFTTFTERYGWCTSIMAVQQQNFRNLLPWMGCGQPSHSLNIASSQMTVSSLKSLSQNHSSGCQTICPMRGNEHRELFAETDCGLHLIHHHENILVLIVIEVTVDSLNGLLKAIKLRGGFPSIFKLAYSYQRKA